MEAHTAFDTLLGVAIFVALIVSLGAVAAWWLLGAARRTPHAKDDGKTEPRF
jgi:hypothetical protein